MLSAYDVSGLKRELADITANEGTFVKYVPSVFQPKIYGKQLCTTATF